MKPKTSDEQKKIFGERIEKIRKEKSMTQIQLSNKLGLNKATISKWECGGSYPNSSTRRNVASVLGVSIHYLEGRTEYPNGRPYSRKNGNTTNLPHEIRTLGLRGDFLTEISTSIEILGNENRLHFLYDFLLAAEAFDDSQWNIINIFANTLSSSYIPLAKSRHPLTSFSIYKSFFAKTFYALSEINNLVLKYGNSYEDSDSRKTKYNEKFDKLLSQLKSFEASLIEDYKHFPKHFQTDENLKKANAKTTKKIEFICKAIQETDFTGVATTNKELCKLYIDILEGAYSSDISSIVDFVNENAPDYLQK